MKPIFKLGLLFLTLLLTGGLCAAQSEIVGFQCPGKESSPRPTAKINLSDVTKKAIQLPRPKYPPLAKAAGLFGNVKAQVLIDMNSGDVVWAQVISGHPLLQAAVRNVVCQARFTPINDVDGRVSGILTYRFARRRGVPHNKALQLTAR